MSRGNGPDTGTTHAMAGEGDIGGVQVIFPDGGGNQLHQHPVHVGPATVGGRELGNQHASIGAAQLAGLEIAGEALGLGDEGQVLSLAASGSVSSVWEEKTGREGSSGAVGRGGGASVTMA